MPGGKRGEVPAVVADPLGSGAQAENLAPLRDFIIVVATRFHHRGGDVVNWVGDLVSSMFEDMDVSNEPCDDCGVTGQSRLYVDGHIFRLCPACAWKLTDEYHAAGHRVPWEPNEDCEATSS